MFDTEQWMEVNAMVGPVEWAEWKTVPLAAWDLLYQWHYGGTKVVLSFRRIML